MLKWSPADKSAEASLLLDGRIMMQVEGEHLDSPDVATELLKASSLIRVAPWLRVSSSSETAMRRSLAK